MSETREIRYSTPETLPPAAGYSHVVETRGGRTIYVSGQVPLDSEGRLVGEGDLPAQAEQVFHNIRLALEHAGASFADVVKLVFYMTDISLIKDVRVIRDRYIDTENPPASSAVEVRRLFRDDIQIEVEAIAVTE